MRLIEARGINNTGWITGTGFYDPDGSGGVPTASHAFLLDASSLVPEPGSLSVLALGAGLFILGRHAR